MIKTLALLAMTMNPTPQDSVWETVFNVWAYDVTEGQARMMNEFGMNADSIWTEAENGWTSVSATNTAFDTVIVHEVNPEGLVGYQFLIYVEVK